MGPTQKKIFIKGPVAAGATVAEAIAGIPALLATFVTPDPVTPDPVTPTASTAEELYMELTANALKAIAAHRSLPVGNSDTKTVLTDAIVADGGDGTVSTAEQSAINAYATYLALDTAGLDAEAASRDPAVEFGVDDDTDQEKARALVVADAA